MKQQPNSSTGNTPTKAAAKARAQAPIQANMTTAEWGLLGLLSVFWGGSFLFVSLALHDFAPLTIVAARVGSAACMLHVLLALLGLRLPREMTIWRQFFTMGLLNNVLPFTLFAWGQQHIPGGLAAIINATTPLFTVLLAHFLTADEALTRGKISGVILGIGGVTWMIGPGAFQALDESLLAQAACLLAAAAYALAGIYGRRFATHGLNPLIIACGQVTCSSLILAPLALIIDRPWITATPSWSSVLSLLALGFFSTVLGYLIYFRILARAGATNVLLVTLLIPVSAIVLGGLVLNERLLTRHFGGMTLISLGLLTIDGRLPQRILRHLRK